MRWVLGIFLFVATVAVAVEPGEMLSDPVLETRAQALDDIIRCVKCRSESIASSNADWARDARVLVRDMIAQGATDQQVLDRFVAAYGDVVLMSPRKSGLNWLLWLAGPLFLGLAVITALRMRRGGPLQPPELSAQEQAAVQKILDRHG